MSNRSLFPLVVSVLMSVAGNSALAQTDGSAVDQPAVVGQKRVLGWVENIRLYPNRMLMKAKLDPGARSSAIHAEDIEEFDQEGRRMVRFTILAQHDDADSDRVVMERPLVREVNIKLRNTTRSDERLAVRLEFCLAGEVHNAVFTLTQRSNFNYPVLLGRQFLKDGTLVDSSTSFTHNTNCPR